MRFPYLFQRRVGGSGPIPTLGSDAAPTSNTDKTRDSGASFKLSNINGSPIQRIAVGYSGPGGALDLPATLYFWEDAMGLWLQLPQTGSATKVKAGFISYFDCPCLMDNAKASADVANSGPGGVELVLLTASGGADPSGTYTFVIGADVSSPAF